MYSKRTIQDYPEPPHIKPGDSYVIRISWHPITGF